MDESSYHYKSPQELRRQIQKRSSSKKSRRRALLIIFVDLVISGLVLAALFYGGFLGKKKLTSKHPIETEKFRISASLEWEKSEGVLYVYVENKTSEPLDFPSSKDRQGDRIVFFTQKQVQSSAAKQEDSLSHQISFPLAFPRRRLAAGETTIYRFEALLRVPTKITKAQLELQEGLLNFPFD